MEESLDKKRVRKTKLEKLRETLGDGYDVMRAEFWAELADTKAVAVLRANMELGVGDQALKAAIEVLNRAIGKPRERHEFTGENGGPVKIEGFIFKNHEANDNAKP